MRLPWSRRGCEYAGPFLCMIIFSLHLQQHGCAPSMALATGLWFSIQRPSWAAGEALSVAGFLRQWVWTWMRLEKNSLRRGEYRWEGREAARCVAVVLAAVAVRVQRFYPSTVCLCCEVPPKFIVRIGGRVHVCAHEDGMTVWGARLFVRYCAAVVKRSVRMSVAGLEEDCGGCSDLFCEKIHSKASVKWRSDRWRAWDAFRLN